MLKLRTPENFDPKARFDQIVEGKQKAFKNRLRAIQTRVHTAYDSYWSGDSCLETRKADASWTEQNRKDLLGCWTVKISPRDKLVRDIRAWQAGTPASAECPYCGIGSSRDTIEHYLPKGESEFPEFATYAFNLIPCCFQCNKPRPWRTVNGQRALLHLYRDTIDEQTPHLHAEVTRSESDGPQWLAKFDVRANSSSPSPFFHQYAQHIETLDLKLRYQDESKGYLNWELLQQIRGYTHTKKVNLVREALLSQATQRALSHGANNWKVATLRAAADNNTYLEYCIGGP